MPLTSDPVKTETMMAAAMLMANAHTMPVPLVEGAARFGRALIEGRVPVGAEPLLGELYSAARGAGWVTRTDPVMTGAPAAPPQTHTPNPILGATLGDLALQIGSHARYFDKSQIEWAGQAVYAYGRGQLTDQQASELADTLRGALNFAAQFWGRPELAQIGQVATAGASTGHLLSPGMCAPNGETAWYPAVDRHGHLVTICPGDAEYEWVRDHHERGLGVPTIPGTHDRSAAAKRASYGANVSTGWALSKAARRARRRAIYRHRTGHAGKGEACCDSCAAGGPCSGCAPGACRGSCAA